MVGRSEGAVEATECFCRIHLRFCAPGLNLVEGFGGGNEMREER